MFYLEIGLQVMADRDLYASGSVTLGEITSLNFLHKDLSIKKVGECLNQLGKSAN